MSKLIISLIILINSSFSFASLNAVDKANLTNENLLLNPGFENGKTAWTASGGVLTTETSGAYPLNGLATGTWDSSAAAQTLDTTAVIPKGDYGKNGVAYCTFITPSGTSTHKLNVTDGTNTLNSVDIVSSTSPIKTLANFIFPTSGSIHLVIESVASDEPLIAIDSCYIGLADNITDVVAQDVFSAYVAANGVVTAENVDWINGDCTNANPRVCTFNTGMFAQTPNCSALGSRPAGSAILTIQAESSTSISIETVNDTGTAAQYDMHIICQKSGTDAQFKAIKPDVSAMSWSGYHDNTCSWARTSTSLGDPTADATCNLVERTNNNFGTVSTSGSVLPAITFTPKRAGKYYVCAFPRLRNSGSGNAITARLTDGTTTIVDGDFHAPNVSSAIDLPLCGTYYASGTGAVTLKIQTAGSAGTSTIQSANIAGVSSIEWSIFSIDQSLPMPQIVNSVTSSSDAGVKIVSAFITNAGTPTVTQQDGNWITSLTDLGVGVTQINLAANTFSAPPNCTCTTEGNGARSCYFGAGFPSTTSLIRVYTATVTPAVEDMNFRIICVGAK